MEIAGDPVFQLKKLIIPEQWKVYKNNFVDLEPDNNYPIEKVFSYFDEGILFATYKDWFIDLGFYGGYLNNDRRGWFKIEIYKGDGDETAFFEFFESFISRSTDEIKDKLNRYFMAIQNGELDNTKGIRYDDSSDFNTHHIYSAIDKIDYRISAMELDEIARPKQK
jgi:hypothetical protein